MRNSIDDMTPVDLIKGVLKSKLFRVSASVIGALIAILVLNPFVIVPAGHRGVVLNWGAVEPVVLDEGMNIIVPFKNKVVPMNVQVQKATSSASAGTYDLQSVVMVITLNYHVEPDAANKVYQEIGQSFKAKAIDPAIQEAAKDITAQYKAEELLTKRGVVSAEIKDLLAKKLKQFNIVIDAFSIENLQFSKDYAAAIEAKEVEKQNVKKEEYILEQKQIQKEQVIVDAQGKAAEYQAKSMTLSDKMLKEKWIEKWNGELPTIIMSDGANSLMNIPQDMLQR